MQVLLRLTVIDKSKAVITHTNSHNQKILITIQSRSLLQSRILAELACNYYIYDDLLSYIELSLYDGASELKEKRKYLLSISGSIYVDEFVVAPTTKIPVV